MITYTQENLTNLLTTDKEKLTWICAEVCYGNSELVWNGVIAIINHTRNTFEPLAKTHLGRSQAFELALKLDCFPEKVGGGWKSVGLGFQVICKDPQAAIVIAAILTAQQEQS